jgi:hypothetical protein
MEWNGTELEPLTGCLKVAPSADPVQLGRRLQPGRHGLSSASPATSTSRPASTCSPAACTGSGFSGRAWAGTVNEQGTLRIRVGKSTTLTTANTVVASHQFFTIPAGSNNADDAADVKFGGYFAVRDSGLYGVALFGKVSVGSFAVGKDDRGRYDLTLNKEGAAAPGLVTVI